MVAKNATITKEQAKEELLKVVKELEKIPTRDEFMKHNTLKGCHKQGIAILFGKNPYNTLLQYAGLSVNISSKEEKKTIKCEECHKTITKLASEVRKTTNSFCSSSCSASFNNKNKPKKYGTACCENCDKEYDKAKDKVSNTCSQFCFMELGMKQRIMKDSVNRSGSNTYDNIRQNARTYSKYFYPTKCMICDYDKHYEVCHVKDLKDFTREETIYEVNNKTNLIHLCPNCHWEFDHNQLDIQKIREAQKAALTN